MQLSWGLWSGSADSAPRADHRGDDGSGEVQSFCSNTSDLLATIDLRGPKALSDAQERQRWLVVTGVLFGILQISYRTQDKAHSVFSSDVWIIISKVFSSSEITNS